MLCNRVVRIRPTRFHSWLPVHNIWLYIVYGCITSNIKHRIPQTSYNYYNYCCYHRHNIIHHPNGRNTLERLNNPMDLSMYTPLCWSALALHTRKRYADFHVAHSRTNTHILHNMYDIWCMICILACAWCFGLNIIGWKSMRTTIYRSVCGCLVSVLISVMRRRRSI